MTPTDAIDRLPHTGVARWVTEVVEASESEIVCRGRIPGTSPFVVGETVPAYVGVELAAQATAVLEIMSRDGQERSGAGFLVRIRDLELLRAKLPAGAPMTVRATRIARALPLCVYEVAVIVEGRPALRGTLGTFVEA